MGKFPRENLVVLCTGCQGEPMAAMSKIISLTHPSIRLSPKDTVIFSSKIIPGNDKRIFRMFNRLVKMGLEVLTEKDHFVHVSGHPSRDELQRMYELVRPNIAIPVHGENVHIHEHARLAREWGAKIAFEIENGQVLKIAPGVPEKVASVESGILAIDGKFYLPPDCTIMKTRRRMQREGIIMATLLMRNKRLVGDPIVQAPGALDHKDDRDLLDILQEEVKTVVHDAIFNSKPKNMIELIENKTRSAIRRVLKQELGKDPMIMVHIENLA
jgi:ribonuclease J